MPLALDTLRQLTSNGTLDDSQVAARLSTGLGDFLGRWERETLPFLLAGGAELRFIEGPYGRGKTHFLQMLELTARRAGFVTSRVQCGLQGSPFDSLADTYRAIAGSLALPESDNGASRGLPALLAQLSLDALRAFTAASRENPAFSNVASAYARRRGAGVRDDLTDDLGALLAHDTGRRVTFAEMLRQDRHLPRPLGRLGKRNAAVWLRSLLALPRRAGFPGLVVLFDETGADLQLRPLHVSIQQRHMANLRNLIDHLATSEIPGCAIVYATTNDLIQTARVHYPALAQRVARLETVSNFDPMQRNPRAIWCRLDELTAPAPHCADFFLQLGEKLVAFAKEAGVASGRVAAVRGQLPALAARMCRNLTQGAVREFIKRLGAELLRQS